MNAKEGHAHYRYVICNETSHKKKCHVQQHIFVDTFKTYFLIALNIMMFLLFTNNIKLIEFHIIHGYYYIGCYACEVTCLLLLIKDINIVAT
jgi:hypothetical protein